MPRTPKVPTLTVGADELREALALVIHAAEKKGVRFVLESVYFEVTRPRGKPINLRLVAADNYRIAWANVVNPAPPADPVVTADKAFASFMLPIDIATALVKDLKPPKVGIKRESVEIAVTDAFGSIVQGGNVRSFQPVGGHFPNYAAIIPTRKPRFTVGVSGKYLADVAKAFGDANVLVLELTGDPLKPITVRSHGKPNHGSVIMPTRLGGS